MRYRLPEGCVGVSIAGASLHPTSDGLVEADAAAAEHFAPHGVLPVERDTPASRDASVPKKRAKP